jgi:acetyl/propionyl-CoA carboxylase alpha subunit
MGADVSNAVMRRGAGGCHRGRPPGVGAAFSPAGERRIDVHVGVPGAGDPVAGRMWERSAWRESQMLIAESPVRHLPPGVEAAMRAVAVDAACGAGWRGDGIVGFALDMRTGIFFIRERSSLSGGAQPHGAEHDGTAHLLQLWLGGSDGHRAAALLVCGVTRGDALRRAYLALSRMRGAQTDARLRLLQQLIASPGYCGGLTGSELMQQMLQRQNGLVLQ